MSTLPLPDGVIRYETVAYNGKTFNIPIFDPAKRPITFVGNERPSPILRCDEPVKRDMNTLFDLKHFLEGRKPISVGSIPHGEREQFTRAGAVKVLDMPIKFPGSSYRIPSALRQFVPLVKQVAAVEAANNPLVSEYYCYLTIDQGWVLPGQLQREAPAHVDGFQGARWEPKTLSNHTYTVSNMLPTRYYTNPFDFCELNIATHDFFWEMNAQVADDNSAHVWQPQDWEITLMDCYCVHRGTEAPPKPMVEPMARTWARLSYEVRIFDRLGNAHNPHFPRAWQPVPRDIEQLGLVAFRQDCDPSLRVFPHQALNGSPLPLGVPKTSPNLRPQG